MLSYGFILTCINLLLVLGGSVLECLSTDRYRILLKKERWLASPFFAVTSTFWIWLVKKIALILLILSMILFTFSKCYQFYQDRFGNCQLLFGVLSQSLLSLVDATWFWWFSYNFVVPFRIAVSYRYGPLGFECQQAWTMFKTSVSVIFYYN